MSTNAKELKFSKISLMCFHYRLSRPKVSVSGCGPDFRKISNSVRRTRNEGHEPDRTFIDYITQRRLAAVEHASGQIAAAVQPTVVASQ